MNESQTNLLRTASKIQSEFPELPLETEAVMQALEVPKPHTPLVLKIIIFFGAFLATGTISAFFGILDIYESELALFVVGSLFLGGTIYVSRTQPMPILQGAYLSFYITGYTFFGFGFYLIFNDLTAICLPLLALSIALVFVVRDYILLLATLFALHLNALIWLFTFGFSFEFLYVYVLILLVSTFFVFTNENKMKTSHPIFEHLYYPLRDALALIWMQMLFLITDVQIWSESNLNQMVFAAYNIVALLFLIRFVLKSLDFYTENRFYVWLVITSVVLLPTLLAPAISGALLLLFLSFYQQFKTGIIISMAGLVWFISKFYYDLSMTLLEKSLLLMGVGVLFLGMYFWFNFKTKSNA